MKYASNIKNEVKEKFPSLNSIDLFNKSIEVFDKNIDKYKIEYETLIKNKKAKK